MQLRATAGKSALLSTSYESGYTALLSCLRPLRTTFPCVRTYCPEHRDRKASAQLYCVRYIKKEPEEL